jgi:hypothetical protein
MALSFQSSENLDDVSQVSDSVIFKYAILETPPDWGALARNGIVGDEASRLLTTMSTLSDTSSLKDLLSLHREVSVF